MKSTFEYVIKKVVDYATRVRTPARIILTCGAALMLYEGIWAGFPAADLIWKGEGQSVSLSVSDVPAEYLSVARLGLAVILMVVGGAWSLRDQRREEARTAKRKAIVIESRGLRDEQGRSLSVAVSDDLRCRVDDCLADLRRFNRDGRVIDPDGAAQEVMQVIGDLHRRRTDKDREDVTLVYGGLTPVPFTFLLGVLLDDEGSIELWDWDRTRERWRKVNDDDDGNRFKVDWKPPESDFTEAVIAVSASYPILDENLERAFPGLPVLRMDLEGHGQDSHWSHSKQAALATQFLDAAKLLEGAGVKVVHLVIAAPNSLVFHLGKRYDRRNVPQAIVYQYERDSNPAYPWGVLLPKPGERTINIVTTTNETAALAVNQRCTVANATRNLTATSRPKTPNMGREI